MQYRGFNIFTSDVTGVDRWNYAEGRMERCAGVVCEVYDIYDDGLVDCLESFTLVLGHDIPNLYWEDIDVAIRKHVDECNMYLNLGRNEALVERRNALIGRLACRLGESLEAGELYDLLSENVGMTDEEIRACGLGSLAPYFNRSAYAQAIAEYMIRIGTENTTTGNWHFSFDTIDHRFGVDLKNDEEMLGLIEDELYKRGEVLSQIDIYDDDFDLMFYLDFCPFSDRDSGEYQVDEEQDATSIGKETNMALKTQKVTAEVATPRYRALHYYLEKEGKTIEGELRKKLEEMYREQVPKEVQEYVKSQNPDMEDLDQPNNGKHIKRQRVGQKHDAVVANPMEPTLSL